MINPRIYFLRGSRNTPTQARCVVREQASAPARAERGISLCERLAFKEARCSKVEAIAVFWPTSQKDSDLRARKTIAVLRRKTPRDEITIAVYFLDSCSLSLFFSFLFFTLAR